MNYEFVVVTTTTGDPAVAERIATDLVDRRLAACVQVYGPVRSTYGWQGKVEYTEEHVVTLKTSVGKLADVKQAIAELHPYDVPELIATPIVDGSPAYLGWLGEQLR